MSRSAAAMHSRRVDAPSRIEPESLLDEARFVQRLARALVHRADVAEDIAQDVLVTALQPSNTAPHHLRGWLATLTRRLASRFRTQERRRANHESHAAKATADEREQRTVERLRLQRRLCEAVESLAEPYRTTVTLRFFDELPPRAIAQRLSLSRDVVRQRLHRGLAMLRAQLDREFGDRHAWLGAFVLLRPSIGAAAWIPLSMLAMKNLALAITALSALVAYWCWPSDPAVAVPANHANAAGSTAAAASQGTRAAPDGALPRTPGQGASDGVSTECTLLLVDDRGQAVPHATVHLWRGEELEAARTTDAEGRCRLAPSSSPWQVLVCADGQFPWRTQLAERRGEHRLQLPAGQEIGGVLVVDGAPPRRRWPLSLAGAVLPDDAPKRLASRFQFAPQPVIRTGPDGTFRCRGVPEAWRGELRLPDSLWLLPESGGTTDRHSAVAVTAGMTNLRLTTTQLPTLFARFVWDDDGSPIQGVDAFVVGWFDKERSSPGFGAISDAAGEIAVALRSGRSSDYPIWSDPASRPEMERVVLHVRDAGIAGRHEFEFDRRQIASGDTHVVRLPRAKTTHFLAIDEAGAPVAGARVQANGFSEPTGVDGRGTFGGTARDVRTVGAPHRRIGPASPRGATAGTAEDPLVYVLPMANSVRLRVLGDDGEPAPFVELHMRSDEEPFWTGGLASWLAKELGHPVHGGHAKSMSQPDGTVRYRDCVNFVALTEGAADVWSLVPGRQLDFVVLDGLRRELARTRCVAPRDGERIDLTLRVPGRPRTLRGRVVDASGAPVAAASVQCADATKADVFSIHATSDTAGAFAVPGLWSREPLRVTIDAPGCVLLRQELPAVDEDRPVAQFVLERGLGVTVRVVDELGEPVLLTPRLDGASQLHDAYEELGPGARRWRRLPPAPQTFRATLGAVDFVITHDPRQPEAVLRVPRPGRLTIVAANGWPPLPAHTSLVARIDRLDAKAPTFDVWAPQPDEETLLVPGRYRITMLAVVDRSDAEAKPQERSLGLTAEVEVTAGTRTRAELR